MEKEWLNPIVSVPHCHRTIPLASLGAGSTQGRNTVSLSTTLKPVSQMSVCVLEKGLQSEEMF